MEKGATLSSCGVWRYQLWRRWSVAPMVCFVGLNPSTADAAIDDPTTRRCIDFAQRWGHGGLFLVNLYAYRATSPLNLWQRSELERCGPMWAQGFWAAVNASTRVVVCWGGFNGVKRYIRLQGEARAETVLNGLHDANIAVYHLGQTASGQPRHPLYRPASCQPQRWMTSSTSVTASSQTDG